MAAMKRTRLGLATLLGVLAVAAIFGWHLWGLWHSGQPVFWLAELWAPVGVLSIGLVSGLDFLLPHPAPPPAAPPRRRKGRRA